MGKEPKGEIKTYLDFGKTQGGRRTSYDYYEGQDAYDLFMGSRYFKDIIAYRKGNVQKVYQIEDLRDQTRKFAALVACKQFSKNEEKKLVFFEPGSAAMGVIDALEYLNKKYGKLNVKNILFRGVDNSEWMNAAAMYTHEQYDVKLWKNVEESGSVPCDLFFAKGVSLMYIYQNEESMCDAIKNSKIAIFDYTFSLKGKVQNFVGTGLPVTFLDLKKCKKLLEQKGKVLIIKPYKIKDYHHNPQEKVTYDCVYGNKEVVEKYFEELDKKTGENPDNYGDPKFVRKEI